MSDDARVSALVQRFLDLQCQGLAPTLEELCGDCPELLDEVRRRVAVAEALTLTAPSPGEGAGAKPAAGSSLLEAFRGAFPETLVGAGEAPTAPEPSPNAPPGD